MPVPNVVTEIPGPRSRELSARLAAVEASFRDVGAAWPPRGVYIRGFKSEAQVELWAAPPASAGSDARWLLVRSFPICASSGELGPKRQLGDYQVPEGFYHVSLFNPVSSYHLSLGVSYPNAADRFHSGRRNPGNAIMIHQKYADGRDFITLTGDSDPSLTHSLALQYGLINWVTKGVFIGERHAYIGIQIDDLLLPSVRFSKAPPYRMTAADLDAAVAEAATKKQAGETALAAAAAKLKTVSDQAEIGRAHV